MDTSAPVGGNLAGFRTTNCPTVPPPFPPYLTLSPRQSIVPIDVPYPSRLSRRWLFLLSVKIKCPYASFLSTNIHPAQITSPALKSSSPSAQALAQRGAIDTTMSFYEAQSWQLPMRQGSWDPPPPPSRSGTSSAIPRDEDSAFDMQIEGT
ncbi:MAG: hypothetical protein LQ337_002884 [Flavoplaca oasis]|nr:MAG: hypothetical protein LQ337_002884 [Flavoplaca oasis]